MLGILFLLSAAVVTVSVMRPPQALWQKAAAGVAAIVLLAVLVAWGIEFAMQAEAEP
jgi:hypothetical protein